MLLQYLKLQNICILYWILCYSTAFRKHLAYLAKLQGRRNCLFSFLYLYSFHAFLSAYLHVEVSVLTKCYYIKIPASNIECLESGHISIRHLSSDDTIIKISWLDPYPKNLLLFQFLRGVQSFRNSSWEIWGTTTRGAQSTSCLAGHSCHLIAGRRALVVLRWLEISNQTFAICSLFTHAPEAEPWRGHRNACIAYIHIKDGFQLWMTRYAKYVRWCWIELGIGPEGHRY